MTTHFLVSMGMDSACGDLDDRKAKPNRRCQLCGCDIAAKWRRKYCKPCAADAIALSNRRSNQRARERMRRAAAPINTTAGTECLISDAAAKACTPSK